MSAQPVRRTAAAAAAALLLLGACGGGDDNSEESEPSASIGSAASAAPSALPSTSPAPSPSEGSEADAAADVEISIELVDGKPDEMPDPVRKVDKGATVELTVSSDKAYEIHVHGYDKKLDVPAGGEEAVTFTADKTGTWTVEVEDTGFKLFDLQVS